MDQAEIAEIAAWVAIAGLPLSIGLGFLAQVIADWSWERRVLDGFSGALGLIALGAGIWSLTVDGYALSQKILVWVIAGLALLAAAAFVLLLVGSIFQEHIGPALGPFMERLGSHERKERRDAFFTLLTLALGLALLGVFFILGGGGFPIFAAFLIVVGIFRLFRPQINDD